MTRKETIRYIIIQSIGNFLVLFAIFGVLATFGPALYYEAQYRIIQIRGVHFSVALSTQQTTVNKQQTTSVSSGGFADVLSGPIEQILTPIDPLFNILIPKIGANARVFPNVDPANQDAFVPILQKGVAHSQGTFFPGQAGNIYLFAHSTDNFWDVGRYNAIFYLLKDLSKGDEVVVFFQNVRHNYLVTDSKIINPQEVSYITKAETGKELLVLQTCWPPGTTWQRLMVFAEPK
ncbi:MAG: class E sortase [Candidatus Levybacteria bacterium]|nr:class E sortase [Candidatus Levybacteria bacterium]